MTFLGNAIPSDYPDFEEFGDTPCSQTDPEAFFPIDYDASKKPGRGYYLYEREAKLVCFECPYRNRCLEYALRHPEEVGIWGGTTEHDRRKMRKTNKRTLRLPPSKHR